MYSEKVMDHFQNPRNVGTIADADGVGQVGNPVCGDMMRFSIKVKDSRVSDVKFQTFGCGAAIAVSSMVSEMAMGRTLDEAMAITNDTVAEELGGLPKNKMHCSNLGADALHAAIEDYRRRQAPGYTEPEPKPLADHHHDEECTCPFCEGQLDHGKKEFCRACQLEFEDCPACGGLSKAGSETCVTCGAPMKKNEGSEVG
jgi:nitrogen fixation protein NifU and related proteins